MRLFPWLGSLVGRTLPIGEGLLVAAIWGSSFIGVKAALAHAGPLTVAAVRYAMAGLLLLPWLVRGKQRFASPPAGVWIRLAIIGLAQYAIGNGALFIALQHVTATAASIAISLVPIPVCLLEILYLREKPSRLHLAGIAVAVIGSLVFFSSGFGSVPWAAFGLLALATACFAVMPVVGRDIARRRIISNAALTAIPLLIGSAVLLAAALIIEGVPHLPGETWAILIGLALVNTLAAYLLFNHALHRLHAGEANILLNLTPIGTALIAWGAFGDRLGALQIGAMALVIAGASLAQWRRGR